MVDGMDVRLLNLHDDCDMRLAYDIEDAANRAVRPGWQGSGAEARIAGWRADDGWENRLFGAWEGEALVGFSSCMIHQDEPDTAWVFAWVLPDSQQRGFGTALVKSAAMSASPTTSRLLTRAYRPTFDDIATLERRFLRPLGFSLATTETVVELDLRSVRLADEPTVEGYSVISYVNGVPEDLRTAVGRIKGLVDSEAPNGELAWVESPVTASDYLDEVARWNAQSSSAVESLALDEHGNVAAWTCLVTAPAGGGDARIEGTLVLREHRGNGLGAAVKIANLHAARALGDVGRVRTSSDDQNIWMRAINSALGFVPVESEGIFHRSLPSA